MKKHIETLHLRPHLLLDPGGGVGVAWACAKEHVTRAYYYGDGVDYGDVVMVMVTAGMV